MKKTILRLIPFMLALFVVCKGHAQVVLTVGGEVDELLALTMEALKELPTRTYSTQSMQGDTVAYDAVRLIDVLELAGVPTAIHLRGKQVQKVVVVTARDGYKAAFSLAELDPKPADGAILLAIGQHGEPLDEQVGPLRLIAPNDQLHSRWVRQVTGIFVVYPEL